MPQNPEQDIHTSPPQTTEAGPPIVDEGAEQQEAGQQGLEQQEQPQFEQPSTQPSRAAQVWGHMVQSMSNQIRQGVGEESAAGMSAPQPGAQIEENHEGIPEVQGPGGSPAQPFDDTDLGQIVPGQDGVPSGLQANAARGAAAAKRLLGFDGEIGGIGERSNKSDHPHGNAIDLMTYDDIDGGWEMARWFHENREALGVTYVIFNGQIASPRDNWTWRTYTHPGGRTDATAMHHDHVHISFKGGQRASGGSLSTQPTGAPQQANPGSAQRSITPTNQMGQPAQTLTGPR